MTAATLRRLAPAATLVAVWAAFVAYAWPGFMTWDSINQLHQARTGSYGDWHPPIMARLWAVLDGVVPGPALMLVLQTGLFVIGLHAVLRRYAAPGRAALLTALVFAFPPVFAPLSTIWKDSLMAALLLCGVAGLLSTARLARLAGWGALVAVAALRYNAPVLIVPITTMIVPYAVRWPSWRRRVLGAGLGIAASIAGVIASRALVRIEQYPFGNMLAMHDLAAVIARAEPMSDGDVRALAGDVRLAGGGDFQPRLRALEAGEADYATLALGDGRVFDLVTSDAEAAAMTRAWRRAIAAHPDVYLEHRLRRLGDVLGWGDRRALPYVTPHSENADLLAKIGEVRSYSRFQRAVGHGLGKISRSIVFWPTLYFVLALGLVVILWTDPVQRGLLIGALGYELALMFLSPGAEYRYSHWMITCAVIATVVRFLGGARPACPARGHAAPG